jgi:hypothetical protein
LSKSPQDSPARHRLERAICAGFPGVGDGKSTIRPFLQSHLAQTADSKCYGDGVPTRRTALFAVPPWSTSKRTRHLELNMRSHIKHVSSPVEQPRSELRHLIESVISRSSFLSGRNLRFEVHEDAVVLRGVVRSYYQKQLAQESLRNIEGLAKINNEIEVVSV